MSDLIAREDMGIPVGRPVESNNLDTTVRKIADQNTRIVNLICDIGTILYGARPTNDGEPKGEPRCIKDIADIAALRADEAVKMLESILGGLVG